MRLFFFILLVAPLITFAQTRLVKDTLFVGEAKYYEGYKIKLGMGSNVATKEFNFIYTSPLSIAGKMYLGSSLAGFQMEVKKIKKYGSKKLGDKYYLVLAGGNIVNYWCEIESALQSGEVIDDRIIKNDQSKPESTSLADELSKLKKLYDDGTITKEEFEEAKKKLLEKY